MPMFRVTDIEWDTDGVDPSDLNLPIETVIEADDEDEVADALSDKYGWCIFGLNIEEMDP